MEAITVSKKRLFGWLAMTAAVTAVIAFGITALLVSVFEHKSEARNPFYRVVALNDRISDPAVWGKDFPMQYDDYRRTVDQTPTEFGGSHAVAHTPAPDDPRSVVASSKLERDPRLKTFWAGYAFAKDYRERRGHAYMLVDQLYTERQRVVKQPGTCINCHASMWTTYNQLGNGNIFEGFAKINHMPYAAAKNLVQHPAACIDCHDPATMQLRVTRPAFIIGMRAAKHDPNYDPNTMATRQEMRSFVCGQCHVEYYFQGPEKTLVYPWGNGFKADEILDYENQVKQVDWVHKETGAGVLKAQHPEFEMWQQGIHARSGVACADCHMPYKREGAMKISDHWVRSPLLNLNRACQGCHRWSDDELRGRVEQIQERTSAMRNATMDAVIALIEDIKAAKAAGASDAQLAAARDFQRKAQFLDDFVEAENSTGFHAPQESARVLLLAMDYARKGQLSLKEVPRVAQAF